MGQNQSTELHFDKIKLTKYANNRMPNPLIGSDNKKAGSNGNN
jgi:hypothetical protein